MRFSVRRLHVCAGKEKRTLRKDASWISDVTEKRTLDALCPSARSALTEKRTLRATTLRVAIARVAAPRATALDVAAIELRCTTSDYEAC